jgi:hypothetical protein
MTDADPRAAVVARINAERAWWADFVAEVGEERMNEPGPMGDWTFKDLAAHLLGWRERTIGRLEAAAEDREAPPSPWPSDLDGDDDRINDWIQQQSVDRSVRDVLDDVDRSYERLANAIAALPDTIVADPGSLPWLQGVPLDDLNLFSHVHDEHEPSVRAWLAGRD